MTKEFITGDGTTCASVAHEEAFLAGMIDSEVSLEEFRKRSDHTDLFNTLNNNFFECEEGKTKIADLFGEKEKRKAVIAKWFGDAELLA